MLKPITTCKPNLQTKQIKNTSTRIIKETSLIIQLQMPWKEIKDDR